jgi:branched-chain amino acid transport system substrate-binding protein
MLLARAIKRAGSTNVNDVRSAAANHWYQSPQGPVWVDPDNNHCFLTPRLARSTTNGQFDIFWEAEAPQKPDPYLSGLDAAPLVRPHGTNTSLLPQQQRLRLLN